MTTLTETMIYEEPAAFSGWFKILIITMLAATFIPGVAIISSEPLAGWVLLGATVFDGLLLHWLLPRRFQLYRDRLRIVLGNPFTFSLSLDTIIEIRAISTTRALFNTGITMATSLSASVEIRRSSGRSLVISPQNRELFLEQVNGALQRK